MKKIVVILLMLIGIVGCNSSRPVIVVKDTPFYKEVSDTPFNVDEINEYVSFQDGNGNEITFDKVTINGSVDLSKVGQYPLEIIGTYKGKEVSETLIVLVVDTKAPQLLIKQEEILLMQNENFDLNPLFHGISAYDAYDGNITPRIQYEGTVDVSKVGVYPIVYRVSDTSGNTSEKTVNVRVVNSRVEYLDYIYKLTMDIYWGNLYQVGESHTGKVIHNFDDIVQHLFTPSMQWTYRRQVGLNGSVHSESSPLAIRHENQQYYIQESDHVRKTDYLQTEFEIQYEDSTYIEAKAIASYGKNQQVESQNTAWFILRYVDNHWKVETFTLPN